MRATASAALIVPAILCLVSATFAEEQVYFADANLKAAVEAALGKANPTPTDMLTLTELNARDRGIVSLTGLEHATELYTLWLDSNQISDLSPLAGLPNLSLLDLARNDIRDFSVLAGLPKLDWLDLGHNDISDISALAGLPALWCLSLKGNQISDISVLSSLTNLEVLWLGERTEWHAWGNQIRDISPLTNLMLLDELGLEANPLNAEAYSLYIPQIVANNPEIDIFYDPYASLAVYRFWSPLFSRHFYTMDAAERDKLINLYSYAWTYEGIAYYAFADAYEADLVPVYRFWSPSLTSHFYTTSEAEADNLINTYSYVWTYEGVAFYAYPEAAHLAEAMPIFRFWSDVLSGHFYTIDEAERAKLIDEYPDAWTYESIAWYALPQPQPGGDL